MKEPTNLLTQLTAAWRRWRCRRAALQLLVRATRYDTEQPSLAQDMRAAAELALDGHWAPVAPATRAAPARARRGAPAPAMCTSCT